MVKGMDLMARGLDVVSRIIDEMDSNTVKESMDDLCETLEGEILKSDASDGGKKAMLAQMRKLYCTQTNLSKIFLVYNIEILNQGQARQSAPAYLPKLILFLIIMLRTLDQPVKYHSDRTQDDDGGDHHAQLEYL